MGYSCLQSHQPFYHPLLLLEREYTRLLCMEDLFYSAASCSMTLKKSFIELKTTLTMVMEFKNTTLSTIQFLFLWMQLTSCPDRTDLSHGRRKSTKMKARTNSDNSKKSLRQTRQTENSSFTLIKDFCHCFFLCLNLAGYKKAIIF